MSDLEMKFIGRYNKLVSSRQVHERSIEKWSKTIKRKKIRLKRLEEARFILTEVTRQTQVHFQSQVESLVTKAIRAVYDRPLEFKLEFIRKANKLQCIPKITEGGNEFDLEFDKGGGLIDIVSFAFRVVLWSLQDPRSRPIFPLDEPMRFVGKGVLLDRAGAILRQMSHELGLQLIIVTHEPQLTRIADRAFRVLHDGTESEVIEIEDFTDAEA